MAKQKKKRTKVYAGTDAKVARPSITRMTAANRNWIQQWWFDNKRIARPVLIAAAVAIVIVWLIIELVRAASGGVA